MKKIIVLFYNFLWGNEPIFPDSLPPEGFEFTFDHDRLQEANAVVFHLPNLFQSMDEEEINKPDGQIWIAWNLESEINYPWVESEEIRSLHIPADTRSAFPVISVQSPVSIQCCWQS